MESSQVLKDRLLTLNLSHNTISDIPLAGSSSSQPTNIHGFNNVLFKDPTTPQTLGAALEIREDSRDDMVEGILEVVDDELPASQVPFLSFNIFNLFPHNLRHLQLRLAVN